MQNQMQEKKLSKKPEKSPQNALRKVGGEIIGKNDASGTLKDEGGVANFP